MEHPSTNINLMAFYEIARRANLTNHPELTKSRGFQKANELYETRATYMWEAFGNREATDDSALMRNRLELQTRLTTAARYFSGLREARNAANEMMSSWV